MNDPKLTIWTIGHSSRNIDEFISLLAGQRIEAVADVRRYPGSRANPQYNLEPLASSLAAHGIDHVPLPELGGRRRPDAKSTNTVWRNAAFRAYADFMESAEFHDGLTRLTGLAAGRRTALLCSEAVWWRCHRGLIADALKADGARVLHIMGGPEPVEHPYTAAARIVGGRLRYGPAEEQPPAAE